MRLDGKTSYPNWTVLYNIVSPENPEWVGTGWEFFDEHSDAYEASLRLTRLGNVVTLRAFHPNDIQHLGAAHRG